MPIFAFLVDQFTVGKVGTYILPNEKFWIFFLIGIPLAAFLSVKLVVLISFRANDARTAHSYGTLVVVPFWGVYILLELGKIQLTQETLLVLSAVLFILIILLLILIKMMFHREEILSNWKTQ